MLESTQQKENSIVTDYQSGSVKSTTYYPLEQVLVVQFVRGGVYHYHKVPMLIHLRLLSAESTGKALHRLVKTNPEIKYKLGDWKPGDSLEL